MTPSDVVICFSDGQLGAGALNHVAIMLMDAATCSVNLNRARIASADARTRAFLEQYTRPVRYDDQVLPLAGITMTHLE